MGRRDRPPTALLSIPLEPTQCLHFSAAKTMVEQHINQYPGRILCQNCLIWRAEEKHFASRPRPVSSS